ncbi:chemotaxis protein CheW [Tepidicella baoligensis]|uniref:chemotaxis protein CheW n=1 Tax=Tepidicella baoligensis TaxID=2707016 RepID=UPI0015DB6029|nr:chemotaxis protein CheW [Tepidicella baoligensis]
MTEPTTAVRPSLQAFQDELARKLAESADRPLASGWLGVSWQGVRALLPLAQAGEIFHPTLLQRVPHTQPWVLGVTSLRGSLTLVVDWVRYLGLPRQTCLHDGDDTVYWISFSPSLGLGAALCVDRLLGLRTSADFVVDETEQCPAGVRQLCRDAQGQRWLELDLIAWAQSPAFLDPRLPAFARPSPMSDAVRSRDA